jgi:hypothetical protein
VGDRFLRTYVAFLYGRANAAQLEGATSDLRRALRHARLRVPPGRSERVPQIARVGVVRQTPVVVQVTATVDDGDVAPYLVTAFVELRNDRWWVTHLADS